MRYLPRQLALLFSLLITSMLALGFEPVHAEPAEQFEPYEAWFVLNMGGQRTGYMHSELKQVGETLVNTSQTAIAIKRGDAELRIDQSSRFVETLDYKPISSESSMKFAMMATTQRVEFGDEKWKITSTNAGQDTVTEMDPPKENWLTPGALAKTLEQAIERGEQEITVTTLDLSMGTEPIKITMKRGKEEDIEVFGKVIRATKWTTTTTATPGIEITQWTDDAGQPVRQTIPLMPGMEIEMLLADKALALTEFDAPEMLAASLITPDKKIKNPRKLKRAVFDIESKDLKENVGDAIPNAGYQTTKWIDGDTLRIEIDLSKGKQQSDKPGEDYLAATSMLNHEDEAVKSLSTKAGNASNVIPWVRSDGPEAVERLIGIAGVFRDYVRNHIDAKDLSVGFASASETARTKQGDCTEHACLLAAMLRGAGIPSRTVTGLVYADQFAGREGVFGFHMWTQAWIATDVDNGYWHDLDAAAPGEINGFDATHIALSTSAMSDGETFNSMVSLLPLMQGMEIRVIEVEWAN